MVESREWHDEERIEPDESQYPLSASGIKKFKRCPEEFRLRYVEGLDGTKPSGGYADLGSAVHESIESVLQENNIASLSETPNQLKELMIGEYRAIDPDIDDEKYDTGLSCLEVAARYTAAQGLDHFRGIEQDFTFALGRDDIDHSFRGTMDVATPSEVWDWKTGKNVYEESEIIQGMVYAMGYLEEFGEPPEKIRFVYLRKEIERVIDPTDDNWDAMIAHARRAIQAKRTGQFEPDPDGSKCYWCSYQGYCDASKGGHVNGAGNVGWSQI
jgi:CRISPR/Cas system-associated exonuclease Cas4 (RecB family)